MKVIIVCSACGEILEPEDLEGEIADAIPVGESSFRVDELPIEEVGRTPNCPYCGIQWVQFDQYFDGQSLEAVASPAPTRRERIAAEFSTLRDTLARNADERAAEAVLAVAGRRQTD